MNPRREEAEQLLAAAQRDRTAFRILLRDAESPVEIVLFHAQQAAEKLIKAVFSLNGVTYRRTHDLAELNDVARSARGSRRGAVRFDLRLAEAARKEGFRVVAARTLSRT